MYRFITNYFRRSSKPLGEDDNLIIKIDNSWSNDYGLGIQGWIISKQGSLDEVEIEVNGTTVPITFWYPRPDVIAAHSQFNLTNNCGFSVHIPRLAEHHVTFKAKKQRITWTKSLVLKNLKPQPPIDFPEGDVEGSNMNILDKYVASAPSPQQALDIFKGEWSSKLPKPFAALQAGSAPLFEDPRMDWCDAQLGGFEGKTVLELGPLEAGHTYMIERLGAAEIVSIEANTRAYLKCLIVKELLELKHTHFLCGDFVEYLRTNQKIFDVCIASGVLYHMNNPVELLALAAKTSDQLFIWTHYYDQAIISGDPKLAYRLSNGAPAEYGGFRHTLYRQQYKAELNWGGFCGSGNTSSNWLSREDILACLRYFGLNDIQINFDQPDHQNGPSFALTAVR